MSLEFVGGKRAQKRIQKLLDAVRSDTAKKINSAAALIVKNNIKGEAPKADGALKRSVVIRRKKYSMLVWTDKVIAPHAHLVEFGTGPRFHKSTGKYVGEMPANPFFARGRNKSRSQVAAVLPAGYKKLIIGAARG